MPTAASDAATTGTEPAGPAGPAEPVQQAAAAAVPAGAPDQPRHAGSAGAAVAEPASRAAVAAVEPGAPGAQQQTAATARARVVSVAAESVPGVAVADQQSGIGMLRSAVADEDSDEICDRIRPGGQPSGTHQSGGHRRTGGDRRGRQCGWTGAGQLAPGERRHRPDHRGGSRLAAVAPSQPAPHGGADAERSGR